VGFLSKLLRRKSGDDPLGKFNLQDESLEHQGVTNGVRVWYTSDGDGIGLYYYDVSPDLPREQPTVEAFCAEYRALMQGNVVETGIEQAGDLWVVRVIGKVPQTPSGMTYVGSYTVPFRDFSYVVKIQCEERGVTGIREAVLMDQVLASKREADDLDSIIGDLATDDSIYDADFPDHPLSRCRKGLRMIASSMSLAEEIHRFPKFQLPSQ